MNRSIKNELIQTIVKLEDLTKIQEFQDEIEYCCHIIIPSLLKNDGYQVILNPDSTRKGINYICDNSKSSQRIGFSYQRYKGKIDLNHVGYLASMADGVLYQKVCLLGLEGYTQDCFDYVGMIDPVRIELLIIDDIKNWVSRIETESDLSQLDYENIIKQVSKTLIERIAADPEFLKKVEWRELEKLLAEVFEGLAFKVQLTPASKDGGKDLILEMTKNGSSKSFIVEIKHWKSKTKVGQNSIKEFVQVICNEKSESGLMLSTYGFTKDAFEGLTELERKKIRFGDKDKIISLCKTYLKVRSGIWTPLEDIQEVLYEQTV